MLSLKLLPKSTVAIAARVTRSYAAMASGIAASKLASKTLLAAKAAKPTFVWVRNMSVSEVPSLSEVLENEILQEQEADVIDQELLDIKALIQKTFKIQDKVGLGLVKLTTTIKGEKIEVEFDCQSEREFEPNFDEVDNFDENEEAKSGVDFVARITNKAGEVLVFECAAGDGDAGDLVKIDRVKILAAGQEDSDELYKGPNFDTLDEKVQDAFYAYLEDHAIDSDMNNFILAYSRDKEQKEYLNWLSKVAGFV